MTTEEFFESTKFFEPWEFDSPDSPGSGLLMQVDLLKKLDFARFIANVPFVINSGYRTAAHNAKVGGVENSAHMSGYACDIRCSSSGYRWVILEACMYAGFERIGVAKTFIHVDADPTKVKQLFWLY